MSCCETGARDVLLRCSCRLVHRAVQALCTAPHTSSPRRCRLIDFVQKDKGIVDSFFDYANAFGLKVRAYTLTSTAHESVTTVLKSWHPGPKSWQPCTAVFVRQRGFAHRTFGT